jgi:hypothetical protein
MPQIKQTSLRSQICLSLYSVITVDISQHLYTQIFSKYILCPASLSLSATIPKHETVLRFTSLSLLFSKKKKKKKNIMSDTALYCPSHAPFFGFAGVFCAVSLLTTNKMSTNLFIRWPLAVSLF